MKYWIPNMTPEETKIFCKLTEHQQMLVHYEGWSAVWNELTKDERNSLIEEFELYGDC